jgi:hypothetical protein
MDLPKFLGEESYSQIPASLLEGESESVEGEDVA